MANTLDLTRGRFSDSEMESIRMRALQLSKVLGREAGIESENDLNQFANRLFDPFHSYYLTSHPAASPRSDTWPPFLHYLQNFFDAAFGKVAVNATDTALAFEAFFISGRLYLNQSDIRTRGVAQAIVFWTDQLRIKMEEIFGGELFMGEDHAAVIASVSKVLDDMRSDRVAGGGALMPNPLDRGVLNSVRHALDRLESTFFGSLVEQMSDAIAGIRAAFQRGDTQDMINIARRARGGLDSTFRLRTMLAALEHVTLSRLFDLIDSRVETLDEATLREWRVLMRDIRHLCHDLSNTVGMMDINLNFVIDAGSDRKWIDEIVNSSLVSLDISTLDKIADMAVNMGNRRGRRADMNFDVNRDTLGLKGIRVPAPQRVPIFRALTELLCNAFKYGDPEKELLVINYTGRVSEGQAFITVQDNGVGIKDVAAVMKEGARERPDLAEGTGTGLASISALAEKHGWRFIIESEHRVGTKAQLIIPVESSADGGGVTGSGLASAQLGLPGIAISVAPGTVAAGVGMLRPAGAMISGAGLMAM